MLANFMILMSLATYWCAWWWHGRMIRPLVEGQTATTLSQLTPREKDRLYNRLQVVIVACCAILETPAIYGLVNAFLNTTLPQLFEWLAVTSIVALVFFRIRVFPSVFALIDRL
jgi:hypothetical protein